MRSPLYGAIEAGGTKFVCAIGDSDGEIIEKSRISTSDPATTLSEVIRFFTAANKKYEPVQSYGVGSFGPLDLRLQSPRYGFITTTPKRGWAYTDLVGVLRRGLGRPVGFDTDVNAAALAERRWGAAQHLESLAYVTVGTGIGGGVIHDGRAVHGMMHPEIGHIRVHRHRIDHSYSGICPFHGDCLEGLASGPAIVERTGRPLSEADENDEIWELQADYLGQLCAQLVLMHSPQRIFFGGGVMQSERLFSQIAPRMLHWLGGYIAHEELSGPNYISRSALGDAVGIKGALALAMDASRA